MKSVLTIAGSDSSGGAGIQADIKTIAAHHLFAQSVITALTAQNTTGVFGVFDVPADFVAQQIDVVFDDIRPDAVKIEVQPDESVIMRARTRSYSGIRKYILGFGTGVEVLEPEWLRNAIRDWHQKAADMYRTEEEKAAADGSDGAEKS